MPVDVRTPEPNPTPAGQEHADPAPQHPEIHYEHTDASFAWILGLIIGSLIFMAIVHGVVMLFHNDYENYQARIKTSQYPLAATSPQALPIEPRLEQLNRTAGIDASDVFLREGTKEAVLNSYGPASGQGYVHIPIERAIERLADKLPARKDRPSADQARRENGLVDGGESNSGRMFRGTQP